MKLPPLTIGSFTAPVPLIQGGMSIRVSTSDLAIPVAECGGIGTIGGSAIPLDELKADIIKAKNATNGMEMVYTLVAENEADLKAKKISVESPIGKGLLGKSVGEIADIQTPNGVMQFEIVEITR